MAALAKARQAKEIMDGFTGPVPTVDQLSTKVLLNRVCLSFAFKALYKIPHARYRREQKLRQIKTLLSDYTLTLDAIAEETSYNGAPALVRFFKKMEGECPGVWRRKNFKIEPT